MIDTTTSGVRVARVPDATDAVRRLLELHGLANVPGDHTEALAAAVRRAWKKRAPPAHALAARERQQAIACTRTLMRHLDRAPRRASTTDDKRRKLVALLDTLHAVVKLATSSGFNVVPVLERLRAGAYTADDLHALLTALEAMAPGTGAAPPRAPYARLVRGGVMAWEASGRAAGYTFNQYTDPPTLEGPLPAFLRDLIASAQLDVPTDNTLHAHLVKLQNV